MSATTFDPDTYRGWGVRQYNWEFSGSVQHELVKQVSVDVGYFRRIYGNLQVDLQPRPAGLGVRFVHRDGAH